MYHVAQCFIGHDPKPFRAFPSVRPRCIQALETKLGAAQEAYDEFMAVKSSVNSRDDEKPG